MPMKHFSDIPGIVQGITPSPEQIPAIVSRGSDLVVVAGAGTGKTRILVGRYLALLAEGIPLRSLIAITFTKKAAREMRNRVREVIRSYLEVIGPEAPDHDHWSNVYENLDAARISTIHSLAADIVRQHPAELGIDPVFVLLEESQAARLRARAVETALSEATQNQTTAQLFIDLGDWKLKRLLTEMFSKRLDLEKILIESGVNLWSIWEIELIQALRKFVEHPVVDSGLDGLVSLQQSGALDRAEAAGDLLVDDLRIVINTWQSIKKDRESGDWIGISRQLGLLRSHLKQKGRGANWEPARPREIIKEIQNLYDDLIGFTDLDLSLDQKLAEEILSPLLKVFGYASAEYRKLKSELSGLDYDDLEQKSLALLESNPSAASYWQSQVQGLLVDEYQDTNDRQRTLINLLNGDGGRLFLVGDGKQSIYRFRGADVEVFRQEQTNIQQTGEQYQLSKSYRAHPGLLENLNALLAPILGDDQTVTYIEPFAPLDPGRASLPAGIKEPYVELHLAAGSKSEGALDQAAEALALRLKDLVGDNTGLEGESREVINYGDIAVLCRAASSFSAYETAFEKVGIPYLTIAGQGFYDRPEIRDLINTLRSFSDLHDDLAFSGFLRSPIGGLSDEDLLILRDYQLENRTPSLITAVRNYISSSSVGDHQKLIKTLGLVDQFSNLIGRLSVAEILSKYIGQTAYLAAYAYLGLERSLQNIKKLIQDAQQSGLVSVADFLVQVEELRSNAVRESEAQVISEGAVQIMTVHQAKGLEFPVVILGDATKQGRAGRDLLMDQQFRLVMPFAGDRIEKSPEGTYQILGSKSFAYYLAAKQEQLREEAESDRLLYVAATRAQDLLIINAAIGKPTKDGKIKKLNGWLGKLGASLGLEDLPVSFEIDGEDVHQFDIVQPALSAALTIYEPGVDFEPSQPDTLPYNETEEIPPWEDYQAEESIPDIKIEIDRLHKIVYQDQKAYAPAWMVGQVVHRSLEMWKFPDRDQNRFIAWSDAEFRKLGLMDADDLRDGYRKTRKILEKFQISELYQRMEASFDLKHEIPFSSLGKSDELQMGVIDALFREGDSWVLVEFKTDRIDSRYLRDFESKLELYRVQVGNYLESMERILGVRPAPVLCYLNYDGAVHLETDLWP